MSLLEFRVTAKIYNLFCICLIISFVFSSDHCEAEFIAVCDINKETKQVIQDLNDAQVVSYN